jgi:hypothetical protein
VSSFAYCEPADEFLLLEVTNESFFGDERIGRVRVPIAECLKTENKAHLAAVYPLEFGAGSVECSIHVVAECKSQRGGGAEGGGCMRTCERNCLSACACVRLSVSADPSRLYLLCNRPATTHSSVDC